MPMRSLLRPLAACGLLLVLTLPAFPTVAVAQGVGAVQGTVTRSADGAPLAGVVVRIAGTAIVTTTAPNGRYQLQRVPAGAHTVVFRWVGYAPRELPVTIPDGGMATLDIGLEPLPVTLSEIMVSGASRAPERVTEAPAAITQVDPRTLTTTAITGQAPLVLRNVPGIDIAQSGVNDFNVNARGFNSTLNRRVLVLQDGRDLAIAFLGSQEWTALSLPTDEYTKLEFVSGPGSALYGANAYSGVLDITTPTAREALGTRVTVGGGFLSGGPELQNAGTDEGWEGGTPATYRFDMRHAGMLGEGRFGYRLNVGFNQTDTWSRSRTLADGTSLAREYDPVSDSAAPLVRELRALKGQTADPVTGVISGDRDPIQSLYGGLRLDYYATTGSVLTAEGGYAKVENEVFVTGIGRVQVTGAERPWARLNWAADRLNVMAYWNGRRTTRPQYSLASGAPLLEHSDIFHLEGQTNQTFGDGRGKFVVGASVRKLLLDTRGSLMRPEDDDRSDEMYAGFAQASWSLTDKVRLVLAGRFDDGTLIDGQFSPKAAVVVTPTENHSFRLTFGQAFQTPNYSEFYLRALAGLVNFTALEDALRASPLGPALNDVPVGQLFACSTYPCAGAASAAVPIVARGNSNLDVETNTGYEIGYRGDLTRRVFLSVDLYYNRLANFVTDLLPAVNPAFPFWVSPEAVPEGARADLETAVRNALLGNPATVVAGLGLTRQENGNTAIVLSYGNAGRATQQGVDVGLGLQATNEIRLDGSVSFFDYDVKEAQVGDLLLANTPEWRFVTSAAYAGQQGLDAGLSFRYSTGFPWAAGIFSGWIEPGVTFDGNVGYRVNNNVRVFMTGTNLLNREWFSMYGGSVTGRRVMGGVSATF